jgi:hypothetical protein
MFNPTGFENRNLYCMLFDCAMKNVGIVVKDHMFAIVIIETKKKFLDVRPKGFFYKFTCKVDHRRT